MAHDNSSAIATEGEQGSADGAMAWGGSPMYRFDKSFEENAALGPRFDEPFPQVPIVPKKSFFGLEVNSRFGIAAGPGINAKWLSAYSRLGFDILTYKTVRLYERIAHPVPNFAFIDPRSNVSADDSTANTLAAPTLPLEIAPTGGSIGMPSLPPEFWQRDIEVAKHALRDGQVLIVSIVGTTQPGMLQKTFVSEFETLARMVVNAGADMVEANLSCPNVNVAEGAVYKDLALSREIALAVRRGAGGRPVLLKVGYLGDSLDAFLRAVAGAADGVVMMNALARKVELADGRPYFGPSRHMAGVHGGAIFELSLNAVKQATQLIRAERLDLHIIGVGGASTPERAAAYIDEGADAALVASSAMLLPFIACALKAQRPDV